MMVRSRTSAENYLGESHFGYMREHDLPVGRLFKIPEREAMIIASVVLSPTIMPADAICQVVELIRSDIQ
jgi:hypothetical protein